MQETIRNKKSSWCFAVSYRLIKSVTEENSHLTRVDASREIASTEHCVGDQFFAEGALTGALRQQGHLGLHDHVSRWTVCEEQFN